MKNIFQKIGLFTILVLSIIVFGQAQPFLKVEKEGQQYYLHTVQEGNTLFSLLAIYGAPTVDFQLLNQGLSEDLTVGQKVYFPIIKETISHEVQAKETLYSLSRKYEVPIDSIIEFNVLSQNTLKIGQVIKIPGVQRHVVCNLQGLIDQGVNPNQETEWIVDNKIFSNDSILEYVVRQNETIYSISKRFMISVAEIQKLNNMKSVKVSPGKKLFIPIKEPGKEDVPVREITNETKDAKDSNVVFEKKETYNIALLLPFFLDKGETNSDYLSNLSTEFYMGTQVAFDSLKWRGLNAKVYVYDVRSDTLTIKKVLAKPEMNDIDLVIGPLNADGVDLVAKWCKKNQVRMVCPVAVNATILKNNPFVYSSVPSDISLMKKLAIYLVEEKRLEQLILVKSPLEKDNGLYEAFRSSYLKLAQQSEGKLKLVEATLENYSTFMRKGTSIGLVVPTNDKGIAVKFMNSCNDISSKFDSELISIYGTKDWMNMEDVKANFKNRFHFHFSSPNDLNYTYQRTANLLKKYRAKYKADLSKIAIQGYDVCLYFCSKLLMNEEPEFLIMNNFKMLQMGDTNGFENENAFVLKQIDFELKNAE